MGKKGKTAGKATAGAFPLFLPLFFPFAFPLPFLLLIFPPESGLFSSLYPKPYTLDTYSQKTLTFSLPSTSTVRSLRWTSRASMSRGSKWFRSKGTPLSFSSELTLSRTWGGM